MKVKRSQSGGMEVGDLNILIRRWAKNSLTKGAEQYIISKMVKQSL